jgi:capsid protein
MGNVQAAGFLEAWRDPRQYHIYGAWISSDWTGAVIPTVDPVKQANGMEIQIRNGLTTRARAAREINGMKYSKIIKRLKSENKMLAEVNEPLEPAPAEPTGSEGVENEEDDTEASVSDWRIING